MAEYVNSNIYTKHGASEMVVASGGTVTVESGGVVDVSSGQGALKLPTIANANVVGGVPVVHRVTVADGATADIDVTLTYKTRVYDVVVVKTAAAGGASDTITVKNGTTAITDAIDINIADKAVARAGTIDDAAWEIAAGGTLRVTRTKASANNVACEVIVYGMKVA